MKINLLKKRILVINMLVFTVLFNLKAQQNTDLISNTFSAESGKNGWTTSDISDFIITDQYTDRESGLTHAYVQQRHHQIAVDNAISVFLIKDNSVLSFTPGIISHIDKKVKTDAPSVTAEQAIGYALKHLEFNRQVVVNLVSTDPALNRYIFEATEISASHVKVQLVYRAMDENVFLAWDVSIEMKNQPHWWNVRIDALTGAYIDKNDFTVECNYDNHSDEMPVPDHDASAPPIPLPMPSPPVPAEYQVFPFPVEAPSFGSRSILMNPSDNTASPFGWHDDNGATGAEYTITRGNNVYAYEDANNDNLPGYSPNSATLQFDYPVDFTQAPLVNQDASITNLFYVNNRLHDVLYHTGFTEAAGNFQQNNYGNGGLGNDYVKAEAFDGSGSNNANFSTPSDGVSGRMQMYLWTAPTPDRDGSFDNGIVAHEYGHGVSNRLTGGPSNSGCLGNSEQGGEGWSDWLALMMTTEPGDTTNGGMLTQARGIGTYALNQATSGVGIRRFKYSVNMAVNPQTYADLATSSGPHQKGEIWCDAIWDMSSFLINDLGFNSDPVVTTSGNYIAMKLVLEGMKLQPCSPGFLDARDAILTADAVLYNNAHRCRIWEAFARRGMGFNAVQGSSNSSTDQTAGFSMPTFCVPATQPPVAAYASNIVTVQCAGSVQFTDQSLQAYSWLWNFGDGNTSTLQNPSHQFNSPGNYNIKLIVTNPLGTDSVTHSITVTSIFTSAVTATPASVCIGSQVQLNALASGSTNASGYILSAIPFAPVTGTPISGPTGDDVVSGSIPIGFSFPFYTGMKTQLKISTNGFISFNPNVGNGCCSGENLPNNSTSVDHLIAVCWTDLLVGSPNSVDYFNLTSPNRFVVRYNNVSHCCGTTPPQVTAQIILYETGVIEIHNTSIVSSTDVMTQGIENAGGTIATSVPGRNSVSFSASNDAFRFTPVISYTYNWQPGNLNGASQTVTPVTSGTYNVTVGDGSGCTQSFTSPVITVNTLPAPVITGSVSFCAGGSASLNAGVFEGYNWSTGASTQSVSVNAAGTYTVTVTDESGCSGSASAEVTVNASPSPSITGNLSFCSGDSTILDAGTFNGYSWSTGETTQTISVNTAGAFTVTVTNGNGCTAGTSVNTTTTVCCNISLSGVTVPATCFGSNTGSIDVTSGNISGTPSYLWDNGATTEDRTGLATGTYTVTVSYGPGCSQTQIFTIFQTTPVIVSGTQINVKCKGANTGSITVSPSGGTFPYTYHWNNGSTVQNRNALVAGTYTVTVTDAGLCTSTSVFTISQPATTLLVNTNKTNVRCANASTGSITVNPSGGIPPYFYSWNTIPVKTTATISGLSAGVYTCTVQDVAGCIKIVTLTITQPPPLVVIPSQTNVTFPEGTDGTASVAVSGGTPGYTYSWNTVPVQTTAGITGLAAGIYKCTINDSKTCRAKLSFTITQPNAREQFNSSIPVNERNMFIYPNPSGGLMIIKITGPADSEKIGFRLFDISGRVIYNHQIQWSKDEEKVFDFSYLSKGVYYIKCLSGKNYLIQKIVIQ